VSVPATALDPIMSLRPSADVIAGNRFFTAPLTEADPEIAAAIPTASPSSQRVV